MAHSAGPRTIEMLSVRISALKNLQCRDDLPTCKLSLSARTRQGHQRLDNVLIALVGAVVRFHAPDREDDVLVDAVFGFDRIEKRPIFDELLLAHRQPLRRDGPLDILAHGLLIFRLILGRLDHLFIERDPCCGLLERIPADTGPLSGRPEALHAGLEPVREGRGRDGHSQAKYEHGR